MFLFMHATISQHIKMFLFLKYFMMLLWRHLFAAPLGRLFALLVRAVVRAAQRLPVGLVPEKHLVATMRLDVVDHRRHGSIEAQLSTVQDGSAGRHIANNSIGWVAQAVHAQRVAAQITDARLLPGVAVAALGAARLVGTP